MKQSHKFLATLIIAAGLIGAGGAAQAGTTYVGFSATLPNLQQGWKSPLQVKSRAGVSGNVKITSVGGEYRVNARMCNSSAGTCGPQITGINDRGFAVLKNGFSSGQKVKMQLFQNPWSPVSVDTVGSWRSQ